MPIYDPRILLFAPRQADRGIQHILHAGQVAIAAESGRIFGVFKPVIGLSINRVVVITEWPDASAATAHGPLIAAGLTGAHVEAQDLWEPTSRPRRGQRPAETGGVYSHRAFDILEADWPRFLELSEAAWGNFEDAHASRVAGFWKCRTAPAPGQLRVRLMAWYENLDAWERSRWWNPAARQGSDESFARFRERSQLLQDTGVSILTRVPLEGEVAQVAATT